MAKKCPKLCLCPKHYMATQAAYYAWRDAQKVTRPGGEK